MALVWSVVLFGLAALVLSAIYLGLAHALSSQSVTREVSGVGITPQGVPFRFEAQQVDQYRWIEREANARALDTLRRYTAGSLLVLFVASVGIGWLVAGRILRPIGHITSVARQIEATDLSRRINLGGPDDELRQLADTFDAMIGRLDEAFEGQREFVHEASHELRNPLAVMRTNLEVALSDPHISLDELRHTVDVAHRSAERMTRLVDDLLIHARIGILSHEREVVEAAAIVNEAVDEIQLAARQSEIAVVADIPSGIWISVYRLGLHQAIGNLMVNALEVSPPGSTIRVYGGHSGGWVWIAIGDEGPGIAPEHREQIFQRFWRDPARSRHSSTHSGLGLAIVRQVIEAHGGTVELSTDVTSGATFVIWLPAVPPPNS